MYIQKCIDLHSDRQTLYFTVAFFPSIKNKTLFQTTRTKLAATGGHWRLLTSPIVKNMWFPYVNSNIRKNGLNTYFTTVFKTAVKNVLDPQTLYFTVANVWQYENEDTCPTKSNETRRN